MSTGTILGSQRQRAPQRRVEILGEVREDRIGGDEAAFAQVVKVQHGDMFRAVVEHPLHQAGQILGGLLDHRPGGGGRRGVAFGQLGIQLEEIDQHVVGAEIDRDQLVVAEPPMLGQETVELNGAGDRRPARTPAAVRAPPCA